MSGLVSLAPLLLALGGGAGGEVAGAGAPGERAEAQAPPARAEVEAALARALEYLLSVQEEDGAFGHWRVPAGAASWFWSAPGTHSAWQLSVTGIVCTALLDQGGLHRTRDLESALLRGLDAIVRLAPECKRISNWDVDNTWGYLYALEAAGRALQDPLIAGSEREGPLRATAALLLERTLAHQSPDGGWAYYDDPPYSRRPTWGTSFMTASFLLAFEELERAGISVDDAAEARGVRALEHCRLPNGAFAYNVQPVPTVGGLTWIDQVKGSLCRIQVGNLALHRRAAGGIGEDDLVAGLEAFFRNHRFISLARGRPYPHEAYYLNSGYFFFYGHYYAAGVIERLPAESQRPWWDRIAAKVLATQEADGSMWDYALNSYSRPYATAWSASVLARMLAATGRGEAVPGD